MFSQSSDTSLRLNRGFTLGESFYLHTHDDNVGHALEGGLSDLGDLILVDAQLLQALGHVGGHVLEHVL